jgi:hypothetical protein
VNKEQVSVKDGKPEGEAAFEELRASLSAMGRALKDAEGVFKEACWALQDADLSLQEAARTLQDAVRRLKERRGEAVRRTGREPKETRTVTASAEGAGVLAAPEAGRVLSRGCTWGCGPGGR